MKSPFGVSDAKDTTYKRVFHVLGDGKGHVFRELELPHARIRIMDLAVFEKAARAADKKLEEISRDLKLEARRLARGE